MAARPTLPYFAPAGLLPAPLPSVADILSSTRFLNTYPDLPTVRVGDHFVVKYGKQLQLQEGENMLFVKQASCVPVPTVYALFHDQRTNKNFIIMEYIPGKLLADIWRGLERAEKNAVASQLRRCMDELRRIPSPGYYGGIWRQPMRDFHFMDPGRLGQPHRDNNISQPQETQEEWADAMWLCVERLTPVITETPHALTLSGSTTAPSSGGITRSSPIPISFRAIS